jgi:low affinity Fe/Cu permease
MAPGLPLTLLMREAFRRFAHWFSDRMGSPWAFLIAVVVIVAWAVSGPWFGYSDSWQLIINTGTTIATFLMVFIIQNTQNRDAKAIHLKLDELLRGVRGARTSLVHLEQWSDEEIAELEEQFERLRSRMPRHARRAEATAAAEAVSEAREAREDAREAHEDAREAHEDAREAREHARKKVDDVRNTIEGDPHRKRA